MGISAGRINLIGTLCLEGEVERLEYSLIEGSCRSGEVKDYLDAPWPSRRSESASLVWLPWTTRRFTPPG